MSFSVITLLTNVYVDRRRGHKYNASADEKLHMPKWIIVSENESYVKAFTTIFLRQRRFQNISLVLEARGGRKYPICRNGLCHLESTSGRFE